MQIFEIETIFGNIIFKWRVQIDSQKSWIQYFIIFRKKNFSKTSFHFILIYKIILEGLEKIILEGGKTNSWMTELEIAYCICNTEKWCKHLLCIRKRMKQHSRMQCKCLNFFWKETLTLRICMDVGTNGLKNERMNANTQIPLGKDLIWFAFYLNCY